MELSTSSSTKIIYMNKTYNKTAVVDCGKNESTIFDGETTKVISHVEVLNLSKDLNTGDRVIIEAAHGASPRTIKSLAQPFTEAELKSLYKSLEDKGISLDLFPQKSTPRAQRYSGLEKSDENDPQAIYKLIQDFPRTSLMKPKNSFEPDLVRQEGWKMKDQMNTILNFARRYKYMHENDANSRWIRENIELICSKLSENAKSVFGLTDESRYKRKNTKLGVSAGDINFNSTNFRITQIYSVLACLQGEIQDSEGEVSILANAVLRESTGECAGWGFAKRHLLCMTPFHMRGGVARSNLFHHGAKNWIKKQAKLEGFDLSKKYRGDFSDAEDAVFIKYMRIYSKSIKELFIAFKEIINS